MPGRRLSERQFIKVTSVRMVLSVAVLAFVLFLVFLIRSY